MKTLMVSIFMPDNLVILPLDVPFVSAVLSDG